MLKFIVTILMMFGASVAWAQDVEKPLPTLEEIETALIENIKAIENSDMSGTRSYISLGQEPSKDGHIRTLYGDSWFRMVHDRNLGFRMEQEYRIEGSSEVHRWVSSNRGTLKRLDRTEHSKHLRGRAMYCEMRSQFSLPKQLRGWENYGDGRKIRLRREDGLIHLSFDAGSPIMQVVLDPEKSFFILQYDNLSSNGKVFRRMTFTPKDMGNGVWIIGTSSRQQIRYDDEGQPYIKSELKYKVVEAKVNQQDFDDTVFIIDVDRDIKLRGLK